jgi:WS/DGAT/MGAT family acyltransferase
VTEEIRFPRVMSNWDTLLWRVEGDPVLRSTTAAVTLLEKPPRRDVLAARLRRATREIPRLRQRVVDLPLPISNPVWSEDPDFDLDYHLRWIRAPRDGSFRALLDHAASVAMQGFDRDRPLWEFVVAEDLEDGRAALIQKLHHSVTDGVAGVLLMQRVYDRRPDPSLPEEEPPTGGTGTPVGILGLTVGAVAARMARGPQTARRRAETLLRFAWHPLRSTRETVAGLSGLWPLLAVPAAPMSPIALQRSSRYRFEALCISLAELKRAAHAAGCKVNDAYLAAVCGGWRRYHEHHGAEVKELRLQLPISLRGAQSSDVAGNRLTLARIAIPVAMRDPRRRMRAIRRIVAAERARPSVDYAESFAGFINALPSAAVGGLLVRAATRIDFIASCVPGPEQPLYLAGARVDSIFPFGPTAGSAANLTLLSRAEVADVTINADPAAVPDHGVLRTCMEEGFAEVLQVAGDGR